MPKIIYITPDEEKIEVEAEVGQNVMLAAINNDIPGIVAECGGACSCATCHVYVEPEWYDKIPGPEHIEKDMLEFADEPKAGSSRLSCQLKITEELDGLTVRIAENQF